MKTEHLHQQYNDLLPPNADDASVRVVNDLHTIYASASVPAHVNDAVARAVQQRKAAQGQRPVRRHGLFGGWQLRTVAVVAALLLAMVAGGTYALAPVLNRAFEQGQEYDPGLQYVLDNHLYRDVDLAQTIDGYTVQLGRVYADASRVIVGYTVSGPENQDNLEGYGFDPETISVTTASGTVLPWYHGGGAAFEGGSQGTTQANVLMFDAAAVEGSPAELNLRLDIDEVQVYVTDAPSPPPGQAVGPAKIVSGPFSFDFAVPFHGGQIVQAVQTVAVDAPLVQATRPLEDGNVEMIETTATEPVAITLERLIVAPSETRLYLRFPDAEGIASKDWSGWPTFSGEGWTSEDFTTIMPNWTRPAGVTGDGFNSAIIFEQDGLYVIILPAPLHEKHGEWTISIPNISAANPGTTRSDGIGGTKLITGPWEFKFIVP